jgi:4-amino-4-deoxy-L-arabinose transferase-like glycosyltransferase
LEDRRHKPENVILGREGGRFASRARVRVRVLVFAMAALLPVVVGQIGRELLPPDDLREAEIAREMWASGDYVLPRLAGLPFVEKPPGFQVVVASAFAWTRGPTTAAARTVSAGFALLTLLAVFALGEDTLGVEGAGLAVAFLGLSQRFCRTAHTVLLDNALTAALAFALWFAWRGLGEQDVRAKERAYTAAGLALGISFLFKGLVGPVLFGAGALAYLAATRRFGELRTAFRPLPIAAFLLPVLAWIVPFLERASPDLVRAFFITNYWGRAAVGYASNVRPFYFYALDLWPAFLPATGLLPFAAFSAFRKRRTAGGEAGLFFLAFAAGPLLLLSLSKAKDSVYALPAYPALALLVATFCEEKLRAAGRWVRPSARAAGLLAACAASVAIVATVYLGGVSWSVVCAIVALAFLSIMALWLGRRGDLRSLVAASAGMLALGWMLWFTGPLAKNEVERRSIRGPVEAALAIAGDRTVLLFNPSDGLRGAASFWRNRTAEEVQDPGSFVRRLLEDPSAVALFHMTVREKFLEAVRSAFLQQGAEPVLEASFPVRDNRVVLLWRARPLAAAPRGYASSASE